MTVGAAHIAGLSPFSVEGPSMRPTLVPGDVVLVRLASPALLQPGAVITFRSVEGSMHVHRAMHIWRKRGVLLEKGDGDCIATLIRADAVEGIVIALWREGSMVPVPMSGDRKTLSRLRALLLAPVLWSARRESRCARITQLWIPTLVVWGAGQSSRWSPRDMLRGLRRRSVIRLRLDLKSASRVGSAT